MGQIEFFTVMVRGKRKRKRNRYSNGAVLSMLSAYVCCVHLPKTVANWYLSVLTVTCLQTSLPTCMNLCQRSVWQVETETCFRWPMCRGVAPRGEAPWCCTADVFLDMAAGPAPRATTWHPESRARSLQQRQRPRPSAMLLLDSCWISAATVTFVIVLVNPIILLHIL